MENPFEIINQRLERIENLLENIHSSFQNKNTKNSYPDILDLQQLTAYLNVSKSYIYKMTATNMIPHSKKGKKIYFDKEIVTKWVLENKISTQGEIEQIANNYLLKKKYGFKKKHN
jgi:excisionase family DNA binding protein